MQYAKNTWQNKIVGGLLSKSVSFDEWDDIHLGHAGCYQCANLLFLHGCLVSLLWRGEDLFFGGVLILPF